MGQGWRAGEPKDKEGAKRDWQRLRRKGPLSLERDAARSRSIEDQKACIVDLSGSTPLLREA